LWGLSLRIERREDRSFARERETLEDLIKELKIDKGFVVDAAASDGISQSCTLGLFEDENWSGLAIEMDPVKFYKLAYLYSTFSNVKLSRNRITPDNIVDLLRSNEIPTDFDVLNLDIDSYDYYVIDSLLRGGFRPKVITMEINEKIPPGIFFTVDFEQDHYWQGDHFYGCSIDAACSVVKKFDYVLLKVDYNNAIFVRSDVAAGRYEDQLAEFAHKSGYQNREQRKEMFPWNADVEHWLDIGSEEAFVEISTHFEKYSGRFTMKISDI
jgi:hypothetical protein